ncbi:hypothetical protein [Pseudomonas sp.]|uniref:hypothetical protein n=1 Tax=Pseudomonas sp. TaxID=306 RepID=UPI003D6F33AF
MDKSAFDRVSLVSALENLVVFIMCGFLLIVGGSFAIDLSKSLPDWYSSLVQEPVSIAYFFILSLLGLVLTGLVTLGGSRDCSGKWWFEYLILAIGRAGISCGFIASGMLLGVGAGLFVITRGSAGSELSNNATQFMKLGVFCLSIAYAITVLMLNLINQRKDHNFKVDALGFFYLLALTAGWFYLDGDVDWKGVGCCLALLIFYCFVGRVWLREHAAERPVERNA